MSGESRRAFLGRLAGWVASGAALLLGYAASAPRVRRTGRLRHDRIPLWHSACSGLYANGSVTVRRSRTGGAVRQITLDPIDSRIWCLCGGALSEADLAASLAAETGLPVETAQARVGACLSFLYRQC